MMHCLIKKTHISLSNGRLKFADQHIEINDKTEVALAMFLSSDNAIVSKDDLLEKVWMGIIVSDASIFKQIQTLRSLLIEAGLPDDSIENVYGKGYRFKYPIKVIDAESNYHDKQQPKLEETPSNIKKRHNTFMLVAVVVLSIVAVSLWSFNQPILNKLNQQQKTAILDIAKNDWQKGLTHIDQLLKDKNNNYSLADLAYLNQQKGQAERNLQKLDESLASLTLALTQYEKLADQNNMGKTHLLLAGLYDFIDNRDQQLNHINQAIDLFKTVENNSAEIDAYLELAFVQKKAGDIDASIQTYEATIARAKAIGDRTGEMIGINNLASTYLIINDNSQALKLAEQGLAINLELGNGQHIANSYSFLSQLQQQLGHTNKALSMIEQALKFQLKTNNHRNLSPKLMSLNYLLLETFQHSTLTEMLQLTATYAESLNIKGGVGIITLYQGMQQAYLQQWSAAEIKLEQAWDIATSKNFNYKRPLMMAFLALTYSKNNNHLKAIEVANQVLDEDKAGRREINLAHLALAISYDAMENTLLSAQWTAKAAESNDPRWQFEYLVWLEFQKSQLRDDDINGLNDITQSINLTSEQIKNLAQNSQFDQQLLNQIKKQVQQLIDQQRA